MDDKVNPHGKGFAAPRRGEGIVDDQQEVVPLGDIRHRFDVTYLENWIGQRFNVENFRVLLDGCLVRAWVSHVGHGG